MKMPALPARGFPAFVAALPVRAAAWSAYCRFCESEGFAVPAPEEIPRDERSAQFVGTAPDGRAFGIGYEWSLADEIAACRRAKRGTWPTDVKVPLRTIPDRPGLSL